MRKNVYLLPLVFLLCGEALAADPADAGKTESTTKQQKNDDDAEVKGSSDLVTNVVGSQEAPTVLNVVPWKDKEVKIERKSPTTSILNQVLQPLDRDVLMREVQYFRSLQEL